MALMFDAVITRLNYWEGERLKAQRRKDYDREMLCNQFIDEYKLLIGTVDGGPNDVPPSRGS
jgi:hypothetical protein